MRKKKKRERERERERERSAKAGRSLVREREREREKRRREKEKGEQKNMRAALGRVGWRARTSSGYLASVTGRSCGLRHVAVVFGGRKTPLDSLSSKKKKRERESQALAFAGSKDDLEEHFGAEAEEKEREEEAAEEEAEKGKEKHTELIFRLERRGQGWGEAVFPSLVVEERPYANAATGKNGKAKSKYLELEEALLGLGVPQEDVTPVISATVAWRVTEGGLVLVDRRRRAKALRRVKALVPYVVEHCEVERERVGTLVAKVPLLILCDVEDQWDRRAVQLATRWFLEKGGEEVPSELKRWTQTLRRHKALGKLSTDQVNLLTSIGFDFGLGITGEWETMFDKLLDFILEYGHSQVMPVNVYKRKLSLHEWTELQRIAYAAGRLAPDHVERLESINFDWKARYISRWLRFYQDYRSSRSQSGTVKLPMEPMPGRKFWRQKQQVLWYNNDILPERQTMLRETSFGFNPYQGKFREVTGVIAALQGHYKADTMLGLLVRLYDDLMVPEDGRAGKVELYQARQLARWMKIHLALGEAGMLTPAERQQLEKLGVQWEGLEWQMNFEALLKFRAIHGHCDVEKEHRLNPWVVNMRQNRHDLPFEYKALLDMVGFTWEKRGAWSRMFAQLTAYREENGHVHIPRQGTNYLHNHLAAWLTNQRALWRMGKLTGQQISRLEAIGVVK